jgi:hypothetical protein
MFPCGFIFRVIIPLYLVEPSSLIAYDSVLLVENLDEMGLLGQVGFQWNGVFDNNIGQRFQTSFELGDVEHNYVLLTASTIAPLDRTLTHTC